MGASKPTARESSLYLRQRCHRTKGKDGLFKPSPGETGFSTPGKVCLIFTSV